MLTETAKFSDTVQKRTWSRAGKVEQSAAWYGRMRRPGGRWQWVKLFTDKRASIKHWDELRRQSEYRDVGLNSPEVDRLKLPVDRLAALYHDGLRAAGKDEDHIRISTWMLDRLIALGGWKAWPDITPDSMQLILAALDKEGAVVSYRNKFIARAKAFLSAFLPEHWAHPLKRVKRIREKGSRKTRARRSATEAQLGALLALQLPPYRTVAYALAAFNGLRRNEARRLIWPDVHLDEAIPFIGIRHKMRLNDEPDFIALHPYVAVLLLAWRSMARGAKVLPAVPDLKTLRKDWKAAGVEFLDDRGRRLDYHALRHTFATNLSRHGCSRATKKKLMRHANQDITDGYSHAELVEMQAALERIPLPAVVARCPARAKYSGSDAADEVSGYPTWVLGPVFGTLSPIPRWIKSIHAKARQVTPQSKDRAQNTGSASRPRTSPVPAKSCPNAGAPWSAGVQRARYVRFRGRIYPRVARPVNRRQSMALAKRVKRLLKIGGGV